MSVALEPVREGDWEVLRRNTETTSSKLRPVKPNCRVTHSVDQSFASAVSAAVAFNTDVHNVGGMHSTITNNTRLTAKVTGLYSVGGSVNWAANATGIRNIYIRRNGTTPIVADLRLAAGGADPTQQSIHTEIRLAAGDYVELIAQQASGGALNLTASASWSPIFYMHRISGYTNEGLA